MYFLNDSKSMNLGIGMRFLIISLLFFILGIIFLLDCSFIIITNLSFFIGLCLLIGIKSTLHFFLKKKQSIKQIKVTIINLWSILNIQIIFTFPILYLYDSATKFPIINRYLRNPQLKKMVDEVSSKGQSV